MSICISLFHTCSCIIITHSDTNKHTRTIVSSISIYAYTHRIKAKLKELQYLRTLFDRTNKQLEQTQMEKNRAEVCVCVCMDVCVCVCIYTRICDNSKQYIS